ncbi:MAG: FAD:protein FMN transferase [Mariprofundaceae bacterium]
MRIRVISFIVILFLTACSPASETVHETRFMMGTLVDFTIYSANKESASIAIRAAADEMQRIENLFTIYGEGSNTIKLFNQSVPGSSIKFPDEVHALLLKSNLVQHESNGAFSPTLGSLNKLWGFSLPAPPFSPPQMDQVERLKKDSANCISMDEQKSWGRANRQCELDFGAIAKGYALEQGMKVLKSHGIEHAIINAGGDIKVSGKRGERAWKVGIRDPRHAEKVMATIDIEGDVSIVTSGDYERSYIYKGRRYHHILNPRTGMPAQNSQSVTVMAKNAVNADAWSTALFVMGEKGLKIIDKMDMDAILVDANGDVHTTKNIESHLQLSFTPPMLRTSVK